MKNEEKKQGSKKNKANAKKVIVKTENVDKNGKKK